MTACSSGDKSIYFIFFAGLAAARLVAYAMATACFTGLPLLTSARMFCLNAFSDFDLTSGILLPLFSRFRRLLEIFRGRSAGRAGFAHLFARSGLDALAFSVDIFVQPWFRRHNQLPFDQNAPVLGLRASGVCNSG
jgi:hypothetical protein